MKVRVKFSKQGNMKFIGHLDVMRYFQKAIRRAGIDIAYTEGLSPHMIMSFASPLGVGLTSDAEYMDIELRTPISSKEAIDALNRVGVEGITVTGFYEIPEGKANKAMTLVAAADYTVRFRAGYEPEHLPHSAQEGKSLAGFGQWKDLASAVESFCAQKEIPVWKKTKKSEKEVDIRPMIYEMRYVPATGQSKAQTESDVAEEKKAANPEAVFLRLASGSAANLKPELVMDTMLGMYGIGTTPFTYEINRCELYADTAEKTNPGGDDLKADGNDTDRDGEKPRRLTPLSALGREIL